MNLTVSNLLTCAMLNPLLMMDGPSIAGTTLASTSAGNVCAISEGATALVTTSSVLSVLLIAVDQYYAVVDPLRYRARVDKLKSAVLIVFVWLVSAVFGLIASLNPNPRSLWLSCTTFNDTPFRDVVFNTSASAEASFDSTFFAFFSNETEEVTIEDGGTAMPILSRTIKIDRSVGLLENSTMFLRTLTNDSVTYGLIYALVHSMFAYLFPFAGVCWIYISIYSAAHRNSERTRRTGSRSIIASASFCEDTYGCARPQHQSADVLVEEFRRIPKISSLSSIDETSETANSINQAPRRKASFSSSADIAQSGSSDEKASSGVVFTVGMEPMEVSASCVPQDLQDGKTQRDSLAVLKTQFLEDDRGVSPYEDLVKSKFRDSAADRRRKSSHDLMYEAVSTRESSGWIAGDSSGSESDDERHYDCFDTLELPGVTRVVTDRRSPDYFVSLGCEGTRGPCEDLEEQGCSERTTRRSDDEANSIVIDIPNYSTMERNQIQHESSGDNPENKKSRRSSRRSSRTGILDGNEESHAVNRSTENSAEPSSCLLTPIVTITPAPNKPGTLNRVSSIRSTSSYINTLKYRISNGSLFRYREETRAARIGALVIVMGLICWSPYVLLNVIKNLPQYSDHEFPHHYGVLALSFLILAAYVSPLLFGYRSRRVKRELRRFFCFRRELSYKNNRSLMAKKVLKRRHSSTLSHLEIDNRYNIFNCVYGRGKWPKEKVQFVQVPDTALAVETCRSSFSSGASTQISSTSTEECWIAIVEWTTVPARRWFTHRRACEASESRELRECGLNCIRAYVPQSCIRTAPASDRDNKEINDEASKMRSVCCDTQARILLRFVMAVRHCGEKEREDTSFLFLVIATHMRPDNANVPVLISAARLILFPELGNG